MPPLDAVAAVTAVGGEQGARPADTAVTAGANCAIPAGSTVRGMRLKVGYAAEVEIAGAAAVTAVAAVTGGARGRPASPGDSAVTL